MIKLRNSLRIVLASLIFFLLASCQYDSKKFGEAVRKFDLSKASFSLESNDREVMEPKQENKTTLSYANFNDQNYKNNIKKALTQYPQLTSLMLQTKMARSAVKIAQSRKNLQAATTLQAGVKSENETTEPSAVASVTLGKLLYDFGSSDFAIDSRRQAASSAELAELMAVEEVGLQATDAWINLARNQEIERVFEEGINLAAPLLGQIKNISTSGISDKKGLLSAKQKYANLELAYEQVKSSTIVNRAVFLNIFQTVEPLSVVSLKPVVVAKKKDSISFSSSYIFQYYDSLIASKKFELESLKASIKPQVSINASATVPVENIQDDGIALMGLEVAYSFNDGGYKKSQIEMLTLELESLRAEKNAKLLTLNTDLEVLYQSFLTASKKVKATQELLDLAVEVRETAKAQLVSGRSSIQDVMNAEVTLAETKIEMVNSKADASIASYKILALTSSYSDYIGWNE